MRQAMFAAVMAAALGPVCSPVAVAQAEPAADEELDGLLVAQQDPDARAELDVIALPRNEPAPTPTPRPKRAQPQLEEIIVTAQRREESVQDVPISITVFTQEQLSNANITNSADLATYTPSLTTNNRFGNENASFSIRGFTQDLRTTASVGVYFAEVVAPRGQSLQTSGDGAGPGALFDLQSVQVLKGPQGTLFGRNTTGGAVLLVPQRPTQEFGGYVEGSAGDYSLARVQGVFNTPITDSFRIRGGLDHHQRDGHIRNITRIGTDHLSNVNYTALRLSGVWDITDELENYTILTYVDSDTFGGTAALFDCNTSLNPLENAIGIISGGGCQRQLEEQEARGENGFYDAASSVATPVTRIKEKRAINTTTWRIRDGLQLKNIFAYAHLYTLNSSEVFGSRFQALYDPDPDRFLKVGLTILNPNFPVTSQETFVEEIQLQGTSFDARLNWQMGAYFENSLPDGPSGNTSATQLSCDPASLEGSPSDYDCFDAAAGLIGSVRTFAFETEFLNQAVYMQGTYELLDSLGLTAGIRYTWDESKGRSLLTRYEYIGPIQQPPAEIRTNPSVKSEAITGLVNLDYKPVDNVMLYAKYVRGYRQGSINMASDPGLDTFKPETVDTYEIGAKTTFGGPVPGRFNFAAFSNDLYDMQLQTGYISPDVGSTTAIFNAGKARIDGFEAELYLQLLDDLTLSLSYSFLDTELLEQEDRTDDIFAAAGIVGRLTATPIADVGDTLPWAPDHTWVGTLSYRLFVPDSFGRLAVSATYVSIGKRRAAASSITPNDELEQYSLLNLNLNWTNLFRSAFDLAAFVTNATDEQYMTNVSGTYRAIGFDSRTTGLPRMIGVRLRYNFGAGAY
jgi:iron complex outermembrane recepter protein